MNLTDENYCVTVVRIHNLVPLDGLDNLMAFPIYGFQALIGKTHNVGELGLLFTAECQLDHDYCSQNNLYSDPEINKDKTKGYLGGNRRIRAIKLRGHFSSALFMPLSSLSYLGVDTSSFKEGDKFNEINGVTICKKYVINLPRKSSNKEKRTNKKKIVAKMFPEHMDTSHWMRSEGTINGETWLIITDKIHGCVSGDTVIFTDDGDMSIKEIVDNRLDVKILAMDTNTEELQYVKIDDYYYKADHGEWYEIELEDGTKIKITGNNPVWMPELKCYRNAEDLVVGDTLLKF